MNSKKLFYAPPKALAEVQQIKLHTLTALSLNASAGTFSDGGDWFNSGESENVGATTNSSAGGFTNGGEF